MNTTIKITKVHILLFVLLIMGMTFSCTEKETAEIKAPKITEIDPEHSFPGEEVLIIGENFRTSVADNKVSFNGKDAEVLKTNGNKLLVVVPQDATSGDVTVTANNLTSEPFSYIVDIPIIPTITKIEPNSGNIGDTVIITGTDFSTVPEENIVSFNGGRAIVIESTETTIKTTVPNDASTGDVTVTRDGTSNGVLFTVTTPIETLTVTIEDDNDDVEEGESNGFMALTSSDLELCEFDTWKGDGTNSQGYQTVGIRFNNISIPKSATILSATIQFTTDATGAEPIQMEIYCENVGNAAPYTEDAYNLTGRPKTSVKAVWDIPEWENVGDAGDAQKTVDLAAVVQEIINRNDWAEGNSINFILVPTKTSPTQDGHGGREAEAGPGDDAATLTITYQQ